MDPNGGTNAIAVYYSAIYIYRAAFVLTYKVRSSVSFFDNLAAECRYRAASGYLSYTLRISRGETTREIRTCRIGFRHAAGEIFFPGEMLRDTTSPGICLPTRGASSSRLVFIFLFHASPREPRRSSRFGVTPRPRRGTHPLRSNRLKRE